MLFKLLIRMQSLMYSFRHWEIKLQVWARIRLLKYGLITQRETLSQSKHITHPSDLLIIHMTDNSSSPHQMTKPSKFIKFKLIKISSLSLDTKTGSKRPNSPLTTGWFAQADKTKPSSYGTLKLKRFLTNSVTI